MNVNNNNNIFSGRCEKPKKMRLDKRGVVQKEKDALWLIVKHDARFPSLS